jgi:leucyl/phenylalanyl-tRNA---protein transferase
VALVGLVDLLGDAHREPGSPTHRLLDVQWMTSHLAQLGAVEIAREEYLELVRRAVDCPLPAAFGG